VKKQEKRKREEGSSAMVVKENKYGVIVEYEMKRENM